METKIKEMGTRLSKSNGSWSAKTVRTEKNRTFEISTYKNITTAREIILKEGEHFISTQYVGSLFDKPFFKFKHEKVKRLTEKKIKEQHFIALAMFDKKAQELTEKYTVKIGDVVVLIHSHSDKKFIVYNIDNGVYQLINIKTLELVSTDRIADIKNKFGIGFYYIKNQLMENLGISKDDLNNMLIDAKEKEKKQLEAEKKEEEKKQRAAEKKAKYLSQFKTADYRKTSNLIKKYIKENYKEVQKVTLSSQVFAGGNSIDISYYAPAKIEELERFLSEFKKGHFNSMEDIYEYSDPKEVILYNHICQKYKYVSVYFEEIENFEKKEEENQEQKPLFPINSIENTTKKNVFCVKYSEKAGVIYGDTKPLKEELKALGCKFNFRLTIEGKKVAGWVFKIERLEEIKNKFCC